jgi:hypothetical protein
MRIESGCTAQVVSRDALEIAILHSLQRIERTNTIKTVLLHLCIPSPGLADTVNGHTSKLRHLSTVFSPEMGYFTHFLGKNTQFCKGPLDTADVGSLANRILWALALGIIPKYLKLFLAFDGCSLSLGANLDVEPTSTVTVVGQA